MVTGLLSVAAGSRSSRGPRRAWSRSAIFLGAWLIVSGRSRIAGAFAARRLLPDWWLLLILGVLEIPLGVLALADPGATLAAIITVAGIWAVAIGVMRIVLAFELKRLPDGRRRGVRRRPQRHGHAERRVGPAPMPVAQS